MGLIKRPSWPSRPFELFYLFGLFLLNLVIILGSCGAFLVGYSQTLLDFVRICLKTVLKTVFYKTQGPEVVLSKSLPIYELIPSLAILLSDMVNIKSDRPRRAIVLF